MLSYSQTGKESYVLKSPTHTDCGDPMRWEMTDALSAKQDLPGGGMNIAADEIEYRRFAGPIGPDEARNRSSLYYHREIDHGPQATVAKVHVFQLKDFF